MGCGIRLIVKLKHAESTSLSYSQSWESPLGYELAYIPKKGEELDFRDEINIQDKVEDTSKSKLEEKAIVSLTYWEVVKKALFTKLGK